MTATEGLLDDSHWGLATWQPLRACKMTAIEGLQDDSHIRLSYPNMSNEIKLVAWRDKWSIHHSIFSAWMKKGPSTCSCLTPAWHILQILSLRKWSSKHFLIFLFSFKNKRLERSKIKDPAATSLHPSLIYSTHGAVSSWQATWAHMSPIAGWACGIISAKYKLSSQKNRLSRFLPCIIQESRRSQCIHTAKLGFATMLASSYSSMCFVLIFPSCRPPLTHLTF